MAEQILPKEEWTEAEKWVWEMICHGKAADFNTRYKNELDPGKEEGWTEERLISSAFLETILFEDKYCKALHRNGIIITGAWLKENLNFRNSTIDFEVQFIKCRFENLVDLTSVRCKTTISFTSSTFISLVFNYAKIESYLNLAGIQVYNNLDMNTIFVGNGLFMGNGSQFKDINLGYAKISDTLDMSYTKVTGNLNMSTLFVGSSLFMNGSVFNEIDMGYANVSDAVILNNTRVKSNVKMNSIFVGSSLFMNNNSEFKDVNLGYAKVSGLLDISSSRVTGKLNMASLNVGSSLLMRDGAEFSDVNLIYSKVSDALDMSNVKIKEDLNMGSLSIGSSLLMRNGAQFKNINLGYTKVAGALDLSTSKVSGKLSLDSISVGSSLLMRDKPEFNNIVMIGGEINGDLDVTGAVLSGELHIESSFIEKSIFLSTQKIMGNLSLILSNVNGSVYISNSEVRQINLGGTNIRGELHVGYTGQSIKWIQNSFMNLRNAGVGALMDAGENSWPDELNLDGFTYSRLGGLFGFEKADSTHISERNSGWFVKWMGKDKSYSPQPYHQLADILTKMGYPDKANAILYSSKNRERDEAWRTGLLKRWFGLSLLKWTIGYGFGGRYFRSLIWVTGLTALGALVLNTMEIQSGFISIWDKIGFSVDMLLPIISLDNRYELNFHGWQLYYFYFHKLMGFLLGSFVVAGLSGITKK